MSALHKQDRWVLIEYPDGEREVASLRDIENTEKEDLRVGSVVFVGKRIEGIKPTATIIKIARDQKSIHSDAVESQVPKPAVILPPVTQPSPSQEKDNMITQSQEPRDFSSSASSWVPSGNDDVSSEDDEADEMSNKKYKTDLYKRHYSNIKGRKRVATPSHRPKPITPNVLQEINTPNVFAYKKEKLNKTEPIKYTNRKVAPDSTRKQNTPTPENVRKKQTAKEEVNKMENLFKSLFNILDSVVPFGKTTYVEPIKRKSYNTVITPQIEINKNRLRLNNQLGDGNRYNEVFDNRGIKIENLNQSINVINRRDHYNNQDVNFDSQYKNDNISNYDERSLSEESNRSDDNVLITNKFNNTVPNLNTRQNKSLNHNDTNRQSEWIPIGTGKTLIHRDKYKNVNWKSYTVATRTLLLAVFPRKVLATHSLTGKKSPAFTNKPAKMCLDKTKALDVIIEVSDRFKIRENLVRCIITTKCADECKMYKMRMKNKKYQRDVHDEENQTF